jgi:hypothetical protein
MSFLDRFKPQPKWKHADPAVRAAAVADVPDDAEHRAVIEELVVDEDVRVRRAAVDRLESSDVEVLVRVARAERDPELRREVAERLVAIATAPAPTDGAAARALDGLEDQKQFAAIAKGSPHDTVRTAALARVQDVKLLGSVARGAADSQVALEAVARIPDAAELLNVALKTEHKDAGINALELAVEAAGTTGGVDAQKETLDNVANRAKSKAVAKRARGILQTIEEAETARRAALEQWQQRVASLLARVEALAASPSSPNASMQLQAADEEWRTIGTDAGFEPDVETVGRFGALMDAARTAIAQHERDEAERRARDEHAAALQAARESLIGRVDAIRGDDALEQIEQARAEWSGLDAEAPAPQAGVQFEEAIGRATARHQNRQEIQKTNARLEGLALEAEQVTSSAEFDDAAWQAVAREWRALLPQSDTLDPATSERFAGAEARVRQRADEQRASAERAIKQTLQRFEQLLERATARAAAEDLTLREADRIARDLRAAIDTPPSVPDREQHALVERLKAAQALVSPRLHELREMDEWKRFANAAVQEELIARTEALRAKYGFDNPEGPKPEDLDKAAGELHEIQERWKLAAEAPRAQAQALWHRYRQAADPIQARVREFFAQRSVERQGNLERKLALIERAEALSGSTDWVKTADELKKLQLEWQQVGPVPRQDTRATWKRFREACDQFFTRRNADLAERKETWSANLAKKEALCARAEELSLSTEWDRASSEIRRMQADWKTIGPVRRNKSEVIWQRFRAACDTFFDRYKRRDEIELESKQADREALVAEMEAVGLGLQGAPEGSGAEGAGTEIPGDIAPAQGGPVEHAALLEQVRSLRNRWNQTAPAVRHGADPLSARFMGALEQLITGFPEAFRGTELDIEANQRKMEKLCDRVEGFLKDSAAAPATGSQALADMLREALASNTIGGRAGEESKWRAMAEDVRAAQAAWSRLGPVPGEIGRQLSDRFHRATSRFFDQYRRHVPQTHSEPPARRGRPVGVR